MTDRDRLINSARPFANSCACKEESGVCEFTDCKTCNATCLADVLIEDGWIRPPCKVGDKVYETQPTGGRTQAYIITTTMWNGHYWWFTWVLKDRNGIYGNVEGFSSHQIGKTVFLTREAAEAALKAREEQ